MLTARESGCVCGSAKADIRPGFPADLTKAGVSDCAERLLEGKNAEGGSRAGVPKGKRSRTAEFPGRHSRIVPVTGQRPRTDYGDLLPAGRRAVRDLSGRQRQGRHMPANRGGTALLTPFAEESAQGVF